MQPPTATALASANPQRHRTDDAAEETPISALSGARSFTESAELVVAYLNAHTPLTDWSVSRVSEGEQVHIHVHHEQVLMIGDRVDWEESFCSRMAEGASHIVRDSRTDSDYSGLQAAEDVGAYAGYTIRDDRGGMFGVLCGVRPAPLLPEETVDEQLVRLLSELLSTQLDLSRRVDRERRQNALAEALAESDALTGVLNRRGWDRLVADAQERVDGFGDAVAVAVVDLDGLKSLNDRDGHAAGDELIRRAADALRNACTRSASVARYGGDEFVILANGVTRSGAATHFERFDRALAEAGVSASLGFAAAEPGRTTLDEAIDAADRMMYRRKRRSSRERASADD